MIPEIAAYISLFAIAFGAATLLPLQSEAVLIGLILKGYSPWLLITVASTGNILGSTVNWWLGREVDRFKNKKWFPVSDEKLKKAQDWYHKYGRWTLLLSWMPIIGDPLTLVAGIMREKLPIFIALVALAKTGRYCMLYLTFSLLATK